MNTFTINCSGLYIIRDTIQNKIMPGAKNQYMFSSAGAAKLSAGHTGWIRNFREESFLEHKGEVLLLTRLAEVQKDIDMFMEHHKVPLWEVDQQLLDEKIKLVKKIRGVVDGDWREFTRFKNTITFAKQKRFVVEEVNSLTTIQK